MPECVYDNVNEQYTEYLVNAQCLLYECETMSSLRAQGSRVSDRRGATGRNEQGRVPVEPQHTRTRSELRLSIHVASYSISDLD